MLKTNNSVDANFAVYCARKNNGGVFRKFDHRLWRMDFFTVSILIKMLDLGYKDVTLQIPQLKASVVSNRGENRRCVRRPADIIDLLLQALNLMTDQFLLIFSVPNSHSPIIGAGEEDWAIVLVPEWTASNFVDRPRVTEIGVEVLLRVRHGAAVNRAVLSGNEVINVRLRILGEVN